MQYLGGKTRMAKEICSAILNDTPARETYIEPFIGGGSTFFTTAQYFQEAEGYDVQEDLILLYQALLKGWEPPAEIPEDEWRELRDSDPSALRAFAGFACSFGGRFFEGYARGRAKDVNFARQGRNKLLKQLEQVDVSKVRINRAEFSTLTPPAGAVVYCDPPYFGTKQYNSKRSGVPTFDHERFWDVMREWRSRGVHVYVSEFSAPDDWGLVWEKTRSVSVAKHDVTTMRRQTDKLFK